MPRHSLDTWRPVRPSRVCSTPARYRLASAGRRPPAPHHRPRAPRGGLSLSETPARCLAGEDSAGKVSLPGAGTRGGGRDGRRIAGDADGGPGHAVGARSRRPGVDHSRPPVRDGLLQTAAHGAGQARGRAGCGRAAGTLVVRPGRLRSLLRQGRPVGPGDRRRAEPAPPGGGDEVPQVGHGGAQQADGASREPVRGSEGRRGPVPARAGGAAGGGCRDLLREPGAHRRHRRAAAGRPGLASELAKQTAEKAQAQQDLVLSDAQRLGIDRLSKLPPLRMHPPADGAGPGTS